MKKLGQAALEFLSTYGFAFLIILVMIGALSYFGVLSPGRFLPERCLVSQEFTCNEFQVLTTTSGNSTGTDLTIILVNNLGNAVNISPSIFAADSDFGNATCSGTDDTSLSGGDSVQIDCDFGSAVFPDAGEKARISFTGTYNELGKRLPRPINGEVFATIQSS